MTRGTTAASPNPGSVLRLALFAWGLGDLALSRRAAGIAWLIGEIAAAGLVAYLYIGLADTTWYLAPFLAGVLFLIAWAVQAALAYRSALRTQVAVGASPSRAASASMAWLTIPLLVWGTGFWLASGSAAGPATAVDRFESSWPSLASGGRLDPELDVDAEVSAAAGAALGTLQRLCASGTLPTDCSASARNLVRDVRIALRIGSDTATATVTVVEFERRPSQFLGIFAGTELVPIPHQTLLTLHLRAFPAPLPGGLQLGAQRWQIVEATTS